MGKAKKQPSRSELTQFGFIFGAASVERWWQDHGTGRVCIGLKTKRHPKGIQIHVYRGGKVRIFSDGKEWMPEPDDVSPPESKVFSPIKKAVFARRIPAIWKRLADRLPKNDPGSRV